MSKSFKLCIGYYNRVDDKIAMIKALRTIHESSYLEAKNIAELPTPITVLEHSDLASIWHAERILREGVKSCAWAVMEMESDEHVKVELDGIGFCWRAYVDATDEMGPKRRDIDSQSQAVSNADDARKILGARVHYVETTKVVREVVKPDGKRLSPIELAKIVFDFAEKNEDYRTRGGEFIAALLDRNYFPAEEPEVLNDDHYDTRSER